MSYLESLRVFVRVVELGSITAGGRDLRTTRKLTPTEIGRAFYDHARRVIDTLDEAEAMVSSFSGKPQGVIRLTAPLGLGRRLIAPLIPPFCDANPGVDFRLRLSDRNVNIVEDAIDLAFFLGEPADSALKWRKIADAPRVLVASPEYLAEHGTPRKPEELADHNCLLLRYPRSPEYFWVLQTDQGQQKMMINGRYDTDDGDVLRSWALGGHGIANRPLYEVSEDLASGRLVKILPEAPPLPAQFGCLTPHRRLQDPKVRMFADFAVRELKKIF